MTWPTNSSNISTTNLDSGTDSPAAARADLKTALDELAAVIDGRAQASGVAPLNASSKIAAQYLPDTIQSTTSTDLTVAPDTGIVQLQNVLRLTPQTTAQLQALSGQDGMIAFCSDATADSAANTGAPVYYHDGFWRRFSDDSTI